MSIHDAEPSDIYVDQYGKLWRVVGTCTEPYVIVEEIEPDFDSSVGSMLGHRPKQQKSGGVSGLMWEGFRRIHRPGKLDPVIPRNDGRNTTRAK